MHTDKIEPIISNGLATIGGRYLISKGIVKVSWPWTDDEGQMKTKKSNNVLYFTYSSVNIPSKNSLTEFIKYDDGT